MIKNPHYVILNFYPSNEEEAKILESCLSENEQILFHCWECFLLPRSEIDPIRKEHILSRTKIKSYKHLYSTIYHKREKSCWYSLKSKDELVKEIRQEYYDYHCIILRSGKKVDEYSYLFGIEENYPYNGNDCRALLIRANNKSDFENRILPKINKIYNNIELIKFD